MTSISVADCPTGGKGFGVLLVQSTRSVTITKVQLPGTLRRIFCARETIAKLLPDPCVCQKTPPRPCPAGRAARVARIALFTPSRWFCAMALTSPVLCSEKSVKFSTKSKSRAGCKVRESSLPNETRRALFRFFNSLPLSESFRIRRQRTHAAVTAVGCNEQRVLQPEQRRSSRLSDVCNLSGSHRTPAEQGTPPASSVQ